MVERVARDIHDDELIRQVVQQDSTSIQVDAQLCDALRNRNVQFGNRSLANHAIGIEAISFLVQLDRRRESVVVQQRIAGG